MPTMEGCGRVANTSPSVICYHECPTDPVPAMGGDCDTQSLCSPGAITERLSNSRSMPGGLGTGTDNFASSQDVMAGGRSQLSGAGESM